MDISDRIRYLRKKYDLTLEDVGNAVGVGKSTVRKWETGMIENMRRDKIAKLAVALHTTPGYLMGWTDDERTPALSPENDSSVPISPAEIRMIEKFRALDARGQSAVLSVLEHEYQAISGDGSASSLPRQA